MYCDHLRVVMSEQTGGKLDEEGNSSFSKEHSIIVRVGQKARNTGCEELVFLLCCPGV